FVSSEDEALYGTGLHQQGWMNLKGRDVELLQHNIDNAIPYLVSTRNYGILWDNNSITRYGDPRGLRPLQESLQVYDASGRPRGRDQLPVHQGPVRVSGTSEEQGRRRPHPGDLGGRDRGEDRWPAHLLDVQQRVREGVRGRPAGDRPLAPELESLAPRVRPGP